MREYLLSVNKGVPLFIDARRIQPGRPGRNVFTAKVQRGKAEGTSVPPRGTVRKEKVSESVLTPFSMSNWIPRGTQVGARRGTNVWGFGDWISNGHQFRALLKSGIA
jgi:hypothetical protein